MPPTEACARPIKHLRYPVSKSSSRAQIGGLAVATFLTLRLVPVFYSIAVLDLQIVKWETARRPVGAGGTEDLNTSNAQ